MGEGMSKPEAAAKRLADMIRKQSDGSPIEEDHVLQFVLANERNVDPVKAQKLAKLILGMLATD